MNFWKVAVVTTTKAERLMSNWAFTDTFNLYTKIIKIICSIKNITRKIIVKRLVLLLTNFLK